MCIGIPGRVVEVIADRPEFALVDAGATRREVSLALLEGRPPAPGDWLLLQLGFAVERMTAAEADDANRLLRVLTEDTEAELLAPSGTGRGL